MGSDVSRRMKRRLIMLIQEEALMVMLNTSASRNERIAALSQLSTWQDEIHVIAVGDLIRLGVSSDYIVFRNNSLSYYDMLGLSDCNSIGLELSLLGSFMVLTGSQVPMPPQVSVVLIIGGGVTVIVGGTIIVVEAAIKKYCEKKCPKVESIEIIAPKFPLSPEGMKRGPP